MLNISWPELENYSYSSSSVESSEQTLFKLNLFKRLRSRLSKDDDPEKVIDIVDKATEETLEEGWDTLVVNKVVMLVEKVLDIVLPFIDLPGPDIIVRPIVKKSILNSVKSAAKRILGMK